MIYFLESESSHIEYTVFDDSDIIGNDQFAFLKAGHKYDCKVGIFGDIDPLGDEFTVLGQEKIGLMNLTKITNATGDIFFFGTGDKLPAGQQMHVKIRRYDLLSVDGIINDRSLAATQSDN